MFKTKFISKNKTDKKSSNYPYIEIFCEICIGLYSWKVL